MNKKNNNSPDTKSEQNLLNHSVDALDDKEEEQQIIYELIPNRKYIFIPFELLDDEKKEQ